MRALSFAFLSIFAALCALPLVARYGAFGPSSELGGVVALPPQVALGARSYYDGSFQKAFEEAFNAALGFREALLRSDNELNLRAFSEFAPSPGTSMILGKHGFIYERDYVDALNRRNLVDPSVLAQHVRRLALLQEYLAAHGSTLLVLISPNKAVVYPENLPSRFVDPVRVKLADNYAVFVRQLTAAGVNFFDAQADMLAYKAQSPTPLFASSGAHWNDPSACRAAAQVERLILQAQGSARLDLHCERIAREDRPKTPDRDLADLANLWFEDAILHPTPYVRPYVTREGAVRPPTVLFVGSSFMWQIMDYETRYKLESRPTLFYYYKTRFDYPGHKRSTLDPKQLDFPRDVFSKQAVVLEINSAVVSQIGWGFLEDAERAIQAQ